MVINLQEGSYENVDEPIEEFYQDYHTMLGAYDEQGRGEAKCHTLVDFIIKLHYRGVKELFKNV